VLVLGIESSCDECAVALVADGPVLLGQLVASQIPIHAPYGGVVPELASRDHIRRAIPVLDGVLKQAGVPLEKIDGIGVTAGPGLIGSLLVGVTMAKTLAFCLKKPICGVNHLEAHLHAVYLEQPNFPYPHLGLVVSGGHTSTYRVETADRSKLLGRTLDDAAGEAFDKIAKLLGLGYPGGVSIERAGYLGNRTAIRFPRPMRKRDTNFSFSGLKTAAVVHVKEYGVPTGQPLNDFAASFQEAVVDTLVRQTIATAMREHLTHILVAGGVAANSRLREEMTRRAGKEGLSVTFPPVRMCTDNAAMVAALSYRYLSAGRDDGLSLDADAGLGWANT
jgi:N6-L-threonylcarbamoyladenine synthase